MSCVIPSEQLAVVLQKNIQADFHHFKELKNTLAGVLSLHGLDAEARLQACLGYFAIYQELKNANAAFNLNGLEKTMERMEQQANQPLVSFEGLLSELAKIVSKKVKDTVRVPSGSHEDQLALQAATLGREATDERQVLSFLDKVDGMVQLSTDEMASGRNRIYSELRDTLQSNSGLIREAKTMLLNRLSPPEIGTSTGFQDITKIDFLDTQLITRADGSLVEVKSQPLASRAKENYPNETAFQTYAVVNANGRALGETIETPFISIYDAEHLRNQDRSEPQFAERPAAFVNEDRNRTGNDGVTYQLLAHEIAGGVTLKNHHHNALKEYLERNPSQPSSLVKMKASKRKVMLNELRLNRLQSLEGLENRTLLTHESPTQIRQLSETGALPVLTTADKVSGFTIHLTDRNGQYLSEAEFVDRFTFVYPDNRTVAVDFENPQHQELVKKLSEVRYTRGSSDYVQSFTDNDLNKLIAQQKAYRKFQAAVDVLWDQAGEVEEIDIPQELFTEHFSLQHILSSTEMGNRFTADSLDTFLDRYTNAATEVEVVAGDEESLESRGFRRLPIVYKLNQSSNPELLSPLAEDEFVRLPDGRTFRWNTYISELGVNAPSVKFLGATHLLMSRGASQYNVPVKLLSYANNQSKQHLLPFFGAMGRLRKSNTKETSEFNRSGWGFPIVGKVKPWFSALANGTYQVSFTQTQNLTASDSAYIAPEVLSKLNFTFKAPEIELAYQAIRSYLGKRSETPEALESLFQQEIAQKQPAALEVLSTIQNAHKSLQQLLGEQFSERLKGMQAEYPQLRGLDNLLSDRDGIKLRSMNKSAGILPRLYVLNDKKDSYPSLSFKQPEAATLHALPGKTLSQEVSQTPKVETLPTQAPTPAVIENATEPAPVRKNINRQKKVQSQGFDFKLEYIPSTGLSAQEFNAQVNYIRSILPAGIEIDDLGKIVNDLQVDGSVLGAIKDRVIYLNRSLSASGTAHHEAFHAVFQYLLEPHQQAELIKAQRIKRGVGVTPWERNEFRRQRKFYSLTEEQIEEKILEEELADGFRDHVLNKQPVTTSLLSRFFEFLKRLMGMFTEHADQIEDFYARIDQGYFATASLKTLKGEATYELVPGVPFISGVDEEGYLNIAERSLGVGEMVMLKNRMVYELLLKSADEKTFSALYDEVASELRKEFTLDNLEASHALSGKLNLQEKQAIANKYERQFTNLRYALGSAHFDKEAVLMVDDTGTHESEYYSSDTEMGEDGTIADMNLKSYDQLKGIVEKLYNQYQKVSVEQQLDTPDSLEDADRIESQESEMGESYREGSMLESMPSEGGIYFRRIFKFQLFEYTDPQLGVKVNKMIDGDAVYDILHRLVGNIPKGQIIPHLYQTIQRLESDYRHAERVNGKLAELPSDLVKTDELLQSLKAVTSLLERKTGISSTQFQPTKDTDGFFNQFINVFYTASPMVQMVQAKTNRIEKQTSTGAVASEDQTDATQDTATFENQFFMFDNLQFSDNRELISDLEKRLRTMQETLPEVMRINLGESLRGMTTTMESMAQIPQGKKKGFNAFIDDSSGQLVFSETKVNQMTDEVYSILSMANLGIPRHAVYFSLLAMHQAGNNVLPRDSQAYRDFKANEPFFLKGQYLTPYFFKQLHQLLRNKGADRLSIAYAQAGPYLSAYDPTLGSAVVTNAEGKKISRYISYTPSLLAIQDIKENGLQSYLNQQFKGTLDSWFSFNPVLSELSAESQEKLRGDATADKYPLLYQDYIRGLEVGVFNGFEHKSVTDEKEASSFGSLDDRSYLLSLLGMFSDRRALHSPLAGGIQGQTFFKPITQFESTSTAFTLSSMYEPYASREGNAKVISKYFKPSGKQEFGRVARIAERLVDIVHQEYQRIHHEWDRRDDSSKMLLNGYNAIVGTDGPQTDLKGLNPKNGMPILRAYHFNYLQDFFGYLSPLKEAPTAPEAERPAEIAEENRAAWNEYDRQLAAWEKVSKRRELRDRLQAMALENTSFLDLNNQPFREGASGSLMRELFVELMAYSEEAYQSFENMLVANHIIDSSGGNYIGPQSIREHSSGAPQFKKLADLNQDPKSYIKDFHHNFWVNSLLVNQIFDGDFAQGIGSFVNYFKRQKSGAAAGANAMSATELAKGDKARKTFRVATINELHVWLDDADLLRQQTDEALMIEAFGDKKRVEVFDGQSFGSLDFRMMIAEAQGQLDDRSREIFSKLRYDRLTAAEVEHLNSRGILLNSLKTVTASPQDYHKLSVHTVQRRDVSVPVKGTTMEEFASLYEQADLHKARMHASEPGAQQAYEEVIRDIHSRFTPLPGREILHHMINSMEFHDVDQLMDETASKRVSRLPLQMKTAGLESSQADYLNLQESVIDVDRNYLFNQVSTAAMHDDTTNGIQQLLLTDADLYHDPNAKEGQKGYMPADLVTEVNAYRNGLANVAKVNLARIQKLMLDEKGEVKIGLLYDSMRKALEDRGATANELKYLETENGLPKYSPSMPNTAKMIEYYFFSLFNKALFAPKIAGKKFFHVSSMGYKLVIDNETGGIVAQSELEANPSKYANRDLYSTRYPGVIKETTPEGKTQYVVEVIVPRALAGTTAEREQIERIEKEFFGTRIPTEDKRSMVVARVVDYIDGSYYNSIIVPYQVHLWSGSDMDIDSLYAQMKASYKSFNGTIAEYGVYGDTMERLRINEAQAKFLEYLQYMETDPLIKDQLSASRQELSGLDFEDIAPVLESVSKMVGLNLGNLLDMTSEEFKQAMQSDETKGYLKRNYKIVYRVVKMMEALNRAGMPTTVAELESFTSETGASPVIPVEQNKILKARMEILKHPYVYEKYLSKERSNADVYADTVKAMGLSESEIVNANNAFTVSGVVTARSLNASSKDGIGITASINKGVSLLVKGNAYLMEPVWTLYDAQGKPLVDEKGETIEFDSYNHDRGRAHGMIGNTLGMFADAAKRPYPSPLNINKYNTPALNTMLAVGLPPQMAIAIHSVPAIKEIIKTYAENYESVYKDPGVKKVSFGKYYADNVKAMGDQLYDQLKEQGGFLVPQFVEKDGELVQTGYQESETFNTSQFKISFDLEQLKGNANVSELGLTVRNYKGEIVPEEVAQYILTEAFGREIEVANEVSFTVTRLTDAQRNLKPDFNSFDSVRSAYEKAKDSLIFGGMRRVLNENPVYGQLEDALKLVDTVSGKLFLKRQPTFAKLVRELGGFLPGIESSELTDHVISYFMLSRFTREYRSQEGDTSSGLKQRVMNSLSKMRNADYWTDYQSEGSLTQTYLSLRNRFPDNAFINAVAIVNSQGQTNMPQLKVKAGLSNELTENVIDGYVSLLHHADSAVQDQAVDLFVYAVLKDGLITRDRKGSLLKVMPAGLLLNFSRNLKRLEEVFKTPLHKKDFKQATGQLKNELASYLFSDESSMENAIGNLLQKVIMGYKHQPGDNDIRLISNRSEKFKDLKLPQLKILMTRLLSEAGAAHLMDKAGRPQSIEGTYDARKGVDVFIPAPGSKEVRIDTQLIPKDNLSQEFLNHLGIRLVSASEERGNTFSFPALRFNKNGQLLLLHEVNGTSIAGKILENMAIASNNPTYVSNVNIGKTAVYRVVEIGGNPDILPYGFSTAEAAKLHQAYGTREKVKAPIAKKPVKVQEETKPQLPDAYRRLLQQTQEQLSRREDESTSCNTPS